MKMRQQHGVETTHRQADFIGTRRRTRARINDEKFITGKNTNALLGARPIAHWGCRAAKSNFQIGAAPVIDKTGHDIVLHANGNQTVLQGFAVSHSHHCDHSQNKGTSPDPSKEFKCFSQHFSLHPIEIQRIAL